MQNLPYLTVLFTCTAAGLMSQNADGVKFDTPQVRVLKVTDEPHHKSALHQHDVNRVMVYLDDGAMTVTDPAGKVTKMHWKAGDVRWSPAGGQHISENIGSKPFRIVEVELKNRPEASQTPVQMPALDPLKVDPKHYKVELDNDQVRVVRARYGAHEKGVMHEHVLPRVVVYLTDQSMNVTTPDGKTEHVENKAGEVKMAGAAKHSEENLSDRSFEVVVVELKR